jgi:hypothetical protein
MAKLQEHNWMKSAKREWKRFEQRQANTLPTMFIIWTRRPNIRGLNLVEVSPPSLKNTAERKIKLASLYALPATPLAPTAYLSGLLERALFRTAFEGNVYIRVWSQLERSGVIMTQLG